MRPPLDAPDPAQTDALAGREPAPDRAAHGLIETLPGRDFRDVLGSFATGVTVVTTSTPSRELIGVTISSFNAVSLDPRLILWSLSLASPRFAAFRQASHYAVNVLALDQAWISDCFASRDHELFHQVRMRRGHSGLPLIDGCAAWFECRNAAHYPGGDHLIFVGEVERFARGATSEPLVFHGGRYRELRANNR